MSSGSHRFRDLKKDKRKHRTPPAPCSSFPSVPCFLWEDANSDISCPLYHLSSTEVTSAPSFSTFRKLKLQHKHPCLCSRDLDQQVSSGRADRGCSGG